MMTSIKFIPLPLLLLTSFSSLSAIKVTDNLNLSGFFSTSIAKGSNEQYLFVNREINDDTCFDCDTTMGLQGDYNINDYFNISIQVVKRPSDHWDSPELEWAYVGFQIEDFTVRAGRLRLPLFLSSEYYYVNQAYTPARLSEEVYGTSLGITSYDGLSINYDIELNDDLYLSLTPYLGINKTNDADLKYYQYELKTDTTVGFHTELITFNSRWMFNYLRAVINSTLTINGFQAKQPEDTYHFYSLGNEFSFYNDWQLTSEMTLSERSTNWYSLLSYHIQDFTPYISYSESNGDINNYSLLIGTRYDLTPTLSINLETQYTRAEDNTRGQFLSPIGAQLEEKDAYLYTLMINYIF